MVRRYERYTAYRTFVVSPGSSANGRKRLPPTIGSRDVLILPLSLQAHELARNPPASLHVERPSRHGSNPLEPAMLRFRRVPHPLPPRSVSLKHLLNLFVIQLLEEYTSIRLILLIESLEFRVHRASFLCVISLSTPNRETM